MNIQVYELLTYIFKKFLLGGIILVLSFFLKSSPFVRRILKELLLGPGQGL